MRKLGAALMFLGAGVGVVAGVWLLLGPTTTGFAWLVSVGLVKLTLAASVGMMGAGAGLKRLAARAEQRADPARQLEDG